jgi:heme exporter protein C
MQASRTNWFHYAAPQRFYPLAGGLASWAGGTALLLAIIGLYIGLFVAPTDAQQGEAYRIIFVHVPAAWMSMVVYLAMAFWAGCGPDVQLAPVRHAGHRACAHWRDG